MAKTDAQFLDALYRELLRPMPREDIADWARRNVYIDPSISAISGWFTPTNCPWVIEPLREFQNNENELLTLMCANQSLKTTICLIGALWAIANDPAPMQWTQATRDEAKFFARHRFVPLLKKCPALAAQLPTDRYQTNTFDISFASMPFLMSWGGSVAKMQQKAIRWMFLDEAEEYAALIPEAKMRVASFGWNSRLIITATPRTAGGVVHEHYLLGDQRVWFFSCARCKHEQQLRFGSREDTGGIKWEKNDHTFPDGKHWRKDALARTVRLQCERCGHHHADTPESHWRVLRHGRFYALNPDANKNLPYGERRKISFHWEACIVPHSITTWTRLVIEWLEAVAKQRETGNDLDVRAFITKRCGRPYEVAEQAPDIGALTECARDYQCVADPARAGFDAPLEQWRDEKVRVLAVDVQQDSFFWVCRAFALGGASRLVGYGRAFTFDELADVQARLQVHSKFVGFDSGFRTAEIYRHCGARGWKCLKGEQRDFFVGANRARVPFMRTEVDPFIGTSDAGRARIPLYLYADATVQDMLDQQMRRLAGDWTIAANVTPEYIAQVTAEEKVVVFNAKTKQHEEVWRRVRRANHWRDCEKISLVMAMACGILKT